MQVNVCLTRLAADPVKPALSGFPCDLTIWMGKRGAGRDVRFGVGAADAKRLIWANVASLPGLDPFGSLTGTYVPGS